MRRHAARVGVRSPSDKGLGVTREMLTPRTLGPMLTTLAQWGEHGV